MTVLNRDWITAHIPHQGSMCLLGHVLSWSEQRIVCDALSHTDPSNPLRAADRLGAAIGVEYAAQARCWRSPTQPPRRVTSPACGASNCTWTGWTIWPGRCAFPPSGCRATPVSSFTSFTFTTASAA